MIGRLTVQFLQAVPSAAQRTDTVRRSPNKMRALVSEVSRRSDPVRILELGTGACTKALVNVMRPDDELTVLTVRPAAGHATRNLLERDLELRAERHRIRLLEGDLQHLVAGGTFDVIVCTLAFNSLPVATSQEVFSFIRAHLRPGGVASWMEHPPWRGLDSWVRGVMGKELPRAAFFRQLLSSYEVRRDLVMGIPPVWVHHARFTPADPAEADRLTPAHQPSSVRLGRLGRIERTGLLPAVGAGALTVSALGGGVAGLDLLARLRGQRLQPRRPWWLVAGPLVTAATAWVARDPDRTTNTDPGAVLAPCDGEVLAAGVVDGVPEVGPGKWARVAIGRPMLGMVIDRAPVAGRITEVRRDGGCCTTILRSRRGDCLVAHRSKVPGLGVVMRHRANALLARGERMGLTRVGGTTEVYLPARDGYPVVSAGQVVRGGETVLMRYHA